MKIAGYIFGGLFLLAALIYAGMKSTTGQKWLVETVNRFAPGIRIDGLSGDLFSEAAIARLTVSDAEGVWLEIDQARVKWHPAEALHGVWHVEDLEAARVGVARAPASPADRKDSEAGPEIPDLSRYRLDRLRIERIELAAALTGGAGQVLSAAGSLDGGAPAHAQLAVHTLEGPPTELSLDVTRRESLQGSLLLSEAPRGVIGHLLHADPAHGLQGAFTGSGDLANWQAGGHLDEDSSRLLDLQAVAKASPEGTTYRISWNGHMPAALDRDFPALTLLGRTHRGSADFTIDADGALDLNDAVLTLDGLSAQAHGRYFDDGRMGLDLTAAAVSLKPFSPLAGTALSGPLAAHLEVKGRTEALAATLDLTSPGVGIASAALADAAVRLHAIIDLDQWQDRGRGPLASDGEMRFAYLGKPVKIAYGGSLEQDETLAVKRLSVDSAYGSVQGEGTFGLSGGAVSAKLTADKLMFAALMPESGISGQGVIALKASGTIDAIGLAIDVRAERLAGLPGGLDALTGGRAHLAAGALLHPGKDVSAKDMKLDAGAISGEARGDYDLANDRAQAKLTATVRQKGYAPLDLAAEGGMTPQAYRLSALTAKAPGIALAGKATTDRKSGLTEGTASLNAGDLAALSALAGEKIGGKADATLALDAANGKQKASLSGHLDRLSAGAITVGHAEIGAKMSDLFALRGINAALKAREVDIGATKLTALDASARSLSGKSSESLQTALTTEGAAAGTPLSLKTNGVFRQQNETRFVDLAALNGAFGGQKIVLEKAVELRLSGESFSFSPLALRYGEGMLTASGEVKNGQADLEANLAHLPFAALMPGNAQPSGGKIDAQLAIKGPARAPDATLHADLETGAPSPGLPSASLHSDITLAHGEGRLKADLKVDQGSGTAEAHLPVSFSLSPFVFAVAANAPLAGSAQLGLPLSAFNPWLRPGGQEVGGQLNGSLTLSGTKSSPGIRGQVQLADARYDGIDTGVCLRHVDALLEGDDAQVRLTRFTSHDSAGGTFDGGGAVALAGAGQIATHVNLHDFRLFCRGPATGNLDGGIRVDGRFADMLVAGQLTLGPLTINLPGGPGAKIPEVKTQRVGEVVRKTDAVNAFGHTIRLDLRLNAPNQVVVRGRGLDAEFKGNLNVAGTAAEPNITGLLETIRGRFELLDKQLSLNTARITFGGPIPPSPFLDISASTLVNGTTITVALGGSAEKPELTLTSSPVLPQDELLAQLLFGRTLSSISPFQAVQLAQSAAELAGKGGGGPGILDKARDALGVDTLTVDQGATTGSTTVGAGKYITPKIYVGVADGTTPDSREVTTQIEVAPSVTAGTTTDSAGQTGVNLNWRWDY